MRRRTPVSSAAPTDGLIGTTQIEYGIVRETENSPGASVAPRGARFGIEITAPGACDECVIKDNCYGSGSLVWATSNDALRRGDAVRLEMRAGTVLRATGWIYGIPLLAIAIGILSGYYLFFAGLAEQPRVLLTALLGLGLMVGAGVILSRFNDWIGSRISIRAFRDTASAP